VSLNPQDVERKTFKERFKGYDMDEVDSFLDRVVSRLQELIEERDELSRRFQEARQSSGESGELIQRTLLTAQRTADETVEEARLEAERVINDARAEAERVVGEAREEAVREREVLQAEAEQLAQAIEELKGFRAGYLDRIRGVIEEQLGSLERMSVLPGVPERIDELASSLGPGDAPPPGGHPVADLPPDEPAARSVLDTDTESEHPADARAGE
jgi:cell division initiation protein